MGRFSHALRSLPGPIFESEPRSSLDDAVLQPVSTLKFSRGAEYSAEGIPSSLITPPERGSSR